MFVYPRYFANPAEAQQFRMFTWERLRLSPASLHGSPNHKIRVFLAQRSSQRKILNEAEVKATLLRTGLVGPARTMMILHCYTKL